MTPLRLVSPTGEVHACGQGGRTACGLPVARGWSQARAVRRQLTCERVGCLAARSLSPSRRKLKRPDPAELLSLGRDPEGV